MANSYTGEKSATWQSCPGGRGDLALRLAAYLGTSAQFWMNLQTSYDLRLAERLNGRKVKKEIQPVQQERVA